MGCDRKLKTIISNCCVNFVVELKFPNIIHGDWPPSDLVGFTGQAVCKKRFKRFV